MSTQARDFNLGPSGILHLDCFSGTHEAHSVRNKERRSKSHLPVDRPEVLEMEESNKRWDVPFFSTPKGVIYAFDDEDFSLSPVDRDRMRREARRLMESRSKFHPNNDPAAPLRGIQQTKKRKAADKPITPLSGLRITVPPAGLEYLKLRFKQAENDARAGAYFGADGGAILDPVEARKREESLVHAELADLFSKAVMPELVKGTCRVDGDRSTCVEYLWLAVHCDSKKIHGDIAFSKISRELMLLGKDKLGRTGPWMTGADLAVRSGYQMKGREADRYRRHLVELEDRAKRTKRPYSVSIEMLASRALFDAMKAQALASGRGQMWDAACKTYVEWAVSREPAKAEYYRLKAEVDSAKRRSMIKDQAEAERQGQIAQRREELSRSLNRHLVSSDRDRDLKTLAKEFKLALIAEAIVDGWADAVEIALVAKVGLEKLLAYLRDLFLGKLPHQDGVGWNQPVRALPVVAAPAVVEVVPPKTAPEAPEVVEDLEALDVDGLVDRLAKTSHGDPVLMELVAEILTDGQSGLLELDYAPKFDVCGSLRTVVQMQSRGESPVEWARELLAQHGDALQAAKEARLAASAAPPAPPTPGPDKAQDSESQGAPIAVSDETTFTPAKQAKFEGLLALVPMGWLAVPDVDLPARREAIRRNVGLLTDYLFEQKLGPFDPIRSVRHGAVGVGETKARELLKLAFPDFYTVLEKVGNGVPLKQALNLRTGLAMGD